MLVDMVRVGTKDGSSRSRSVHITSVCAGPKAACFMQLKERSCHTAVGDRVL